MKVKQEQQHVEQSDLPQNNEISTVKTIDSSVFDNFKKLTSDNEKTRINAGLHLIQYFTKIQNDDKKEKEFQYALKRLIRGLGASTTLSRSGFFTTFVGFLKLFLFSGINIDNIIDICKKQLHTGNTISNKEDSDAIVGQILTCGSILRSNHLANASPENVKNITELLISCSKHRTYHNSLAYSFIVELLQNVNENQFIESVWPLLEPELKRSWNKQTINTVNCLFIIRKQFPNVLTNKYLKENFAGSQLLNSESAKYLYKIFWENNTTSIVTHPAFENFGRYIASCKYLKDFWTQIVDEKLSSNPNKLIEIETLKILTDILLNENTDSENETQISNLLTENFIQMIMKSLKNMKLKKDETLKAFYDDFFEAIVKYCSRTINESNCEKYDIVCKLILHPGLINIEKYIDRRIIHQILVYFSANDVKKLFEIYKNIFLGNSEKNPNDKSDLWLNNEKQLAGYMLQTLINHKNIQNCLDWKAEQLKFMMKIGLFYTNNKGEIIKKPDNKNHIGKNKENDEKSKDIVGNEFSVQIKNIFYSSLQTKLTKLKDKKKILMELIETCNETLQKKNFNKFLRIKINEKTLKTWNEMYTEIHGNQQNTRKNKSDNNRLQLVFHVLLLHMGLQLFKEPEMAETAIIDLKKCLEKSEKKKIQQKLKKKQHNNHRNIDDAEAEDNEEPEWIEVVVDLFLHLLSQNVNALRVVVDSVFPYLCDKLTLTAVHQILSVLDMSNENNPLSEDNDEENNEAAGNKDNEINDEENENGDSEDDENDEDDDDDDDDSDIMDEEEEDEATITDKLRNAVSTALTSITKEDDDQSSIDLDDMDEEEGKRLDEALSNAFRAIKKTKENDKKSKGYRVKTITLMHFRIRVLDLIEIYTQNNPDMLITIEIMLSLYNMIEYCCNENELQSLASKLDKVLGKLTSLRRFSNTNNDEINVKNICDYLRLIIEKKPKAQSVEMVNKFKSKCCMLLISCEKILSENNSQGNTSSSKGKRDINEISNLLAEYLDDFIKSRNPIVTISLLTDIFKMRWNGIWQLAKYLIEKGLNITTRTFRRIQVLELFETLYNNTEMFRQSLNLIKGIGKKLNTIENYLQDYVKLLSDKSTVTISVREFSQILNVFYSMEKCYNKIGFNDSSIDKNTICNHVQNIRQRIKLENAHSYIRFCNIFELKIIKNSQLNTKSGNKVIENDGKLEVNSLDDENEEYTETVGSKKNYVTNSNMKKIKNTSAIQNSVNNQVNGNLHGKRKNNEKNNRKDKKLKKEERMKIVSEGLNGGFSFTSNSQNDIEVSD